MALKKPLSSPPPSLIDILGSEIEELEKTINLPSTVVCTHLICEPCKQAMEEERKEKEILQIKLDEKKQLFERIKIYGTNK